MFNYEKTKSLIGATFLSVGVFFSGISHSANLDIANVPLFLGDLVKPNIMFTMDDSGSMYWSFMPDTTFGYLYTPLALAANFNKIAYDPAVTYPLPVDADGRALAMPSFTAAWNDGYEYFIDGDTVSSSNCTINLETNYRPTWYYGDHCDSYDSTYEYAGSGSDASEQNAFYYVYYPNHPTLNLSRPSGCTSTVSNQEEDYDCYVKVVVDSTSGPGNTDERTNFSSWYSYYRKRVLLAKGGVGRAFAEQGTGLRVGYGSINKSSTTIDGTSTGTVITGVRDFEDKGAGQNYRTDFFTNLYNENASGGTPLRRAADEVGQYFKRTDTRGPWSQSPGISGGSDFKCQQSFHILMSDGYWSTGSSNDANGDRNDDVDSSDGPTITGPALTVGGNAQSYQFKENTNPFDDDNDDTLADVAMYYWNHDLRSDLDNEVPTNASDPHAFWQHLVTFTVGLGITGNIDPIAAFDAVDNVNGATINWPDPFDGSEEKVDDMLHAAVNSYGGFFTASNPLEFAASLKSAISDVQGRQGSSAAVAISGATIGVDTRIYQVRFNSADWTGSLLARSFLTTGERDGIIWDAADLIPTPGSRKIVTYDDATSSPSGQPFLWANLTTAQKLLLDPDSCASNGTEEACDGDNLVDYLRGTDNATFYRIRTSDLGDVINSAPVYVGSPTSFYPDSWGTGAAENSTLYSAFKTTHSARTPLLYIGANDGMMHVFNASTGVEQWAYVPNAVFNKLKDLGDRDYSHQYYVDGALTVRDAFFDGAWHSVLLGSLGAGGQGIFAIDITTAHSSATAESTIASKVLWEFSDADSADMGYSFSQPEIARMNNGDWAALFGNGYNNTYDNAADGSGADSTTGNAVLYIRDIEDGSLIKTIDTGVGSADDPEGTNRPNGLSDLRLVDLNGDAIADAVYAGDLFGNLWKFDLSDTDKANWAVAYNDGTDPKPLFSAKTAVSGGASQPITTKPLVIRHQSQPGQIVLFGTGKYFEVGDSSSSGQDTQSFYGVWDRNSYVAFDRSHLLEQEIFKEVTVGSSAYRLTTDNSINWYPFSSIAGSESDNPSAPSSDGYLGWYMDLFNTENSNTDNYGERQVTNAVFRGNKLFFTTLVPPPPSADVCGDDGNGWLFALDIHSGASLSSSAFNLDGDDDLDGDDVIDDGTTDADGNTNYRAPSGKKTLGFLPTPGFVFDTESGNDRVQLSDSTGELNEDEDDENISPGGAFNSRQSWQQLIKD